jgi:hypothetical protein
MPVLRCMTVTGVALLLGAGCSPALDWREWRAAEPGVSLTFPCKPVRQQRMLVLAGRSLRMVMDVCDADGASWALAYADVRDLAAVPATLLTLVDAAHGNLGVPPPRHGTQTSAPTVPGATPNAAGGRFRIEGRRPDGQAVREETLIFAKGMWVVQVTALGRQLPAQAPDAFIESVRADR